MTQKGPSLAILLTGFSILLSACVPIYTQVGATSESSARLAQPLGDNERILICLLGEHDVNLQDYVNEYCPNVKALYRSSDEECATLISAAEKGTPFSGRTSEDLIHTVRYVFRATLHGDVSLHLPLYAPPIAGVLAIGKSATWTVTVWGLPTGEYLGDIAVSSKGEEVVVQWFFGVDLIPETMLSATRRLAQEICGLLKGAEGGSE